MDDTKNAVIAAGTITDEQVASLETLIYSDGTVDRDESIALFEINNAISSSTTNSSNWTPFFVKAQLDHVLGDPASPGAIDADEHSYLKAQIGADGKVDASELDFLVATIAKASSCTQDHISYVMDCVKASVLEDGVISAAECEMISTIIYGAGGEEGSKISRHEADWLFALNDAVAGKVNAPEWTVLFATAIGNHVTQDETSPGVIDAAEAAYLIEKCCADGTVDAVEKALLGHVLAVATTIDAALTEKMDFLGITAKAVNA